MPTSILKPPLFNPPPPIQSSLLRKAPDSIPPTPELEQLHDELQELKKISLARAKKAGDDLKAIEESMRRMKEKEKGKARAVVKRERDYTPLPDVDDSKSVASVHSLTHPAKSRLSSHTVTSLPPSARSSVDPRRSAADDFKKKKKKRKRELEDGDSEHESQRARKATPPVPVVPPHPPQKAQKSTSSSHLPKPPPGPDFTLPPPIPLLSPRPPYPQPPTPGPSKPTCVTEDFSKLKQPAQILVTSFYSSIELWLRPIREEDIGFLEHTGDEVEPYVIPRLGRHYTEVWEDQDNGLLSVPIIGDPDSELGLQVEVRELPKWDPSTLSEPDCLTEERGHGPLTERVLSALLPAPDHAWKGVKAAEDAMEGRPGGSGAAAARREKMNVADLEIRIRDRMRWHGLLPDGVPDYTEKVDDPIATALRHAQRELRAVVAANKARRARLVDIARDRLGHQEYLELRDSIDRNINTTYAKLQRKDGGGASGRKKKKEKEKERSMMDGRAGSGEMGKGIGGGGGGVVVNGTSGSGNGTGAGTAEIPPAARGLGPDEHNRLVVSEQLRKLVETRRQWVDVVGGVFEEKQREYPGSIWGFPLESVYKGVEEVGIALGEVGVRTNSGNGVGNLNGVVGVGGSNGKGKEKATGNEMDIG